MSGSTESGGFTVDTDIGSLIVIAGLTAVLFAGGLAITGGIPEFGMDIDLKPFFIVYVVILFVPWGTPTLAAAVGATLAEGILDFFEGLEPDEPFGWAGYLVGFTVAGFIFDNDTSDYVKLTVGAIMGGFVQFVTEGMVFLVLGMDGAASLKYVGLTLASPIAVYVVSVIGNTLTHGVILGVLPLIPLVQYMDGRIERIFPHAAESQQAGTGPAE